MSIKDLTDADLKKINEKLKNAGAKILLTPELVKSVSEILPKGLKLELDPQLKAVTNEMLAKAAEGKVMKVEVMPLISSLRKALKEATKNNPPEMEVGVQSAKLRKLIEEVLNKHGFHINISTINDNYTKVVQQKLNGRTYKVKIHADAKEITRSVQASLMQVQSRYFGLQVSRDILYRSIDEALGGHRFPISIAVQQEQARKAVQDALLRAQVIGKDQTLAYQRVQTGELRAAQAELAKLKAAHLGAADAARAHSDATKDVGNSLFSLTGPIKEVKSILTNLWSINAAKQFLSQVIEIGGELEHQKIAMDTIFGDKGKTLELFGQIKGLARQSPFGVMELTKSVKALSAYGVEYNEIYDTAKRLADISAATSVDINRLILAFGKTKSRTFLDGLEAKQFAYANIPIYDLLSKKLTELEGHFVSIGEVMERQKKRQISFDLVKDVLWDITDPGGKFYNMQEALAGSVKTSWKLVRDNIELMFGEIADSSMGDALKDVAVILQKLTRNWKSLGATLGLIAITFGVYKTAVAASNIIIGKHNLTSLKSIQTENAKQAKLIQTASLYRRVSNAESDVLAMESALNRATRMSILSRKQLTKTQLENLYASNALNRDMLLRLAATGRLQKGSLALMRQTNMLSYADMRYLARLRMTYSFMGRYATATSALAMRFQILGSAIGSAFKSLGAMVFNPVMAAMAVIGAATYGWQKNSQENDAAEEFGKNFQTKGEEAAKNIGNALTKNTNVSGHEAKQLLEEYRNLIKDFSSTPDKIISEALFDDNGNIRNTAEQIAYLRTQLEQLKTAAEDMADSQTDSIIKATNSGLGIFDDDMVTDMKDWQAASKGAESSYLQFVSQNKELAKQMVEAAANVDTQYSASISKMETLLEKFNELMKNRQKYSAGYKAAEEIGGDELNDYTGKWLVDIALNANVATRTLEGLTGVYAKLRNLVGVRSTAEESNNYAVSMEEMKQEIKEGADAFKTLTENWDYKNLTPAQAEFARKFWNGIIEQAEISAPDARKRIQSIISDTLGIDIQGIEGQSLIAQEIKSGGDRYLSKELADKLTNGLAVTSEEQQQVDDAIKEAYLTLFDKARHNRDRWAMEALNSAVGDDGHYSKGQLLKIQAKLDLTADWDNWKREINQELDGNKDAQVWIKGSPDMLSFVKSAQEGYKAAKNIANELEPMMLKAGISFDSGSRISLVTEEYRGLSPLAKQMVDDYNDAVDSIAASTAAGKKYGFDPAEEYNKRNRGNKKDKFAEGLKQRFKDIKDAWSEFQKWSKTEGREAAAKRIGESGLFSTLSADQIPKTIEDYRALIVNIENELRQAGVKGTAREGLLNDLLKQLLDIDKTVVDEQLKLALDKVSKEAERQLADWNLFDKIRKATGNQDLAMSIAFGMNVKGETDYPAMIKQQLKKTVDAAENALSKAIPKEGESPYEVQGYNYEKLKELYDARETDKGMQAWMAVPEEIRKAWEKANGDILKYFDQQRESVADIITKYQSLQDKLAKIDYDRNEEIRKINESKDLTPEQKAQTIQRINVEADYQKFTQSADYLKFFSGIYSLTMDKAQEIGDKIRLHLDQRLQAGKISAEDYYKEIERINQQLSKLRNVKSDAMTFMTGGVKGLNQKKMEKADSAVLAQTTKVQEAQEALEKAKASGDIKQVAAAELTLKLAKKELEKREKIRDAIVKDMESWQNVLDVANIAANIAGGLSDAFNSIKDMAAAFGADTESGSWLDVGGLLDTLTAVTGGIQKVVQSAMSGDIGGVISGVVSTITTPFTIWADIHDKKLQKMIERSQEYSQQLQYINDAIERRMGSFLGNAKYMRVDRAEQDIKKLAKLNEIAEGSRFGAVATQKERSRLSKRKEAYEEGGAYGYQRQLMEEQLAELEKQRAAEADKKNVNKSALAGYDDQIDALRVQIFEFSKEVANSMYGIDLKGWASELGDALFDAWKKGEDGADAFKRKAGEILGNVMNNVLKIGLLEPMMQDVSDYLFGTEEERKRNGGKGGAFGTDFELSPNELEGLAGKLMKGMEGVDAYNSALDQLEKILNEKYGLSMKEDEGQKSGLSAGIQGITENTADLLASYLNSIRADVSLQTYDYWARLLNDSLPQISVIAQSQLDCQRQIAENTLRNAVAAEAIVKSNDDISRLLTRVTQGGAKFYVN